MRRARMRAPARVRAPPCLALSLGLALLAAQGTRALDTAWRCDSAELEDSNADHPYIATEAGAVDLAGKSFTLEAWVKRYRMNATEQVLSQGDVQPAENTKQSLFFGFAGEGIGSNTFRFSLHADDAISMRLQPYADDVGHWHHWAATFDADRRERRLYRDGVLVGSAPSVSSYRATGALILGRHHDWTGGDGEARDALRAEVDEVRVWGAVLTQAQLAFYSQKRHNYVLTQHPHREMLMLYYMFNGVPDNATSVTDVSSAGAHGSIFGEGSAFEGVPGVGKGGCCSSRCKLCGAADGDVNLPSSPGLLASTY